MGLDIAGAAAGAAAAFGGDLLGLSKPTKAKLITKPGDPDAPKNAAPIPCMFNPTEYSLSRTNSVQRNQSPQVAGGTPQYAGSSPLSLTMQLFFDDFA